MEFCRGAGCRVRGAGREEAARTVLASVPQAQQIDMIAKTDPGTAAAALQRCAFYIGNDSGLMHCAAAAESGHLGLFGPSWPHLYQPWGRKTAYVATPQDFARLTAFEGYNPKTLERSLMEGLTVEAVLKVAEDLGRKYFSGCHPREGGIRLNIWDL